MVKKNELQQRWKIESSTILNLDMDFINESI